jgi:hypothetical protein
MAVSYKQAFFKYVAFTLLKILGCFLRDVPIGFPGRSLRLVLQLLEIKNKQSYTFIKLK